MGEEEDGGAGWRVERTNSGEGRWEMWVSKADFQGAGGVVRWVVVVDMVWRRRWRRWWGAMVAEFVGFLGSKGVIDVYCCCCCWCP